MADVARRAGVTTATVSLALRNKPNIPATTRDRIVALAEKLGYLPNPYVSALMRSRRRGRPVTHAPMLALVCGLDRADGWRNSPSPTRRLIREGVVARAAALGYQTQDFWLHQDGMSAERFSDMLHARGIEGLLLGPLPDGAAPPALRWEYFSAVSLSVPFHALPVSTVCNDHYFSSFRAVVECSRLGYRRPGLVLRASHREHFQGRWEAGFFAGQNSQSNLGRARPLFVDNLEEPARFDTVKFRRWLERERPDVIVTNATDFLESFLRKLGHRVPEDIGIAGLSCPELGQRVSGICQNGRLIGATAVNALVSMIERHEKGLPRQAVTTMVEGIWNLGSTLVEKTPAAIRRPRRRR
jgi:LacI family transcriptional regulator